MRRGRAVPWLRANWWVLIIGAVGVVLAFGISGFAIAEPRESFIDRLYATLQLFVLEWNGGPNPPARLEIARLLAPLVAAAGLVGLAGQVVQAVQRQEWRVRPMRGHIVVCGLGDKGRRVALAARREGRPTAIITLGLVPQSVEDLRDAGARIILGSAMEVAILQRASVASAHQVIALCGDDGVNAQVAAEVLELTAGRTRRPDVLLHLDSRELKNRLVSRESAVPFNMNEVAAGRLLDGELGKSLHAGEQLVVVGFGEFGESLVLAAIAPVRGAQVPPIVVVDEQASEKLEALRATFSAVPGLSDADIQPLDLRVGSAAFERGEWFARLGAPRRVTFVIGFNDDTLGVSTALAIRRLGRAAPATTSTVFVRVLHPERGLATFLEDDPDDEIRPFSVTELGCQLDHLVGAPGLGARRGTR